MRSPLLLAALLLGVLLASTSCYGQTSIPFSVSLLPDQSFTTLNTSSYINCGGSLVANNGIYSNTTIGAVGQVLGGSLYSTSTVGAVGGISGDTLYAASSGPSAISTLGQIVGSSVYANGGGPTSLSSSGGVYATNAMEADYAGLPAYYAPNGGVLVADSVETTSSSSFAAFYAPNGGSTVGLDSTARHHVTAVGTPTIAAGAAAGTNATITVSGTDAGGVISLTTGTSPSGNAILFTLTYFADYPSSVCGIALFPRTSNAAAQMTNVFLSNSATTSFRISVSTALTASSGYIWFYTVNC